jgi:hypothetical protein
MPCTTRGPVLRSGSRVTVIPTNEVLTPQTAREFDDALRGQIENLLREASIWHFHAFGWADAYTAVSRSNSRVTDAGVVASAAIVAMHNIVFILASDLGSSPPRRAQSLSARFPRTPTRSCKCSDKGSDPPDTSGGSSFSADPGVIFGSAD